ncbi:four-carbon acid sugar kinase family protein [Arthrobacter sp.]|uniref:four-carbon acid sugar kinase family protein n=1 Tax=Arthrobacter sp. TaxID=1667 RepID=UPI003390B437
MSKHALARWAIIADDLTGAADAAAAYGPTHSSSVVLTLDGEWPDSEILAINTESRYLPDDQATAVVGNAVERAVGLGRRVFKKFDSLLRGNVGVELAAAAAGVADGGMAIVAPAFPATGRTTVNGIVHVNAAPNTEGMFGGDVCRALAAGGLRAESILRSPSRRPEDLAKLLREMHARGIQAAVVDAESDADLRTIVDAAGLMDVPTLLAGSGGLAGHIEQRKEASSRELATGPGVGRTLMVIGSYSTLARLQIQELVAAGVSHVTLDHGNMSGAAVHRELLAALDRGDVVLTPDPSGTLDKSQANAVARALALATAAGIGKCGSLFLTGGETATAVLAEIGVTSFTVLGEIEPGVVASRLGDALPLMVTKAGAFGDAGTLLRAAQLLTRTTTEMSSK